MEQVLDIADVARATGLTARALRFYEARGLVRPLRTAGGRRVFGPGELARLNAIVALKRAGFTLAAIGGMLGDRKADLGRLVAAQLAEIDARAAELADTRALLLHVQSRIDRGEPIDVATLCSLIRKGNTIMEPENWKQVTDRYFTPEEKARWAETMGDMSADFDQAGYARQWQALGARIEAVLDRHPSDEEAEGLVREWFALLEPFSRVATPEMWQGSVRLYERMPEWEGQADPGFSARAWGFVRDTAARMRAEGKEVGPLPAFLAGSRQGIERQT